MQLYYNNKYYQHRKFQNNDILWHLSELHNCENEPELRLKGNNNNNNKILVAKKNTIKNYNSSLSYSHSNPKSILKNSKKLKINNNNNNNIISDSQLAMNLKLAQYNKHINWVLNYDANKLGLLKNITRSRILAVKTRSMLKRENEIIMKNKNLNELKENNNNKELLNNNKFEIRRSARLANKTKVNYENLDEFENKKEYSSFNYESIMDNIPDISSIDPRIFRKIYNELNNNTNVKELFEINNVIQHQMVDDKIILVLKYLNERNEKEKNKILKYIVSNMNTQPTILILYLIILSDVLKISKL